MIKSFAIEENNKLSKFLINYKRFFQHFENKNVILAFISKKGIAYYHGKFSIHNARNFSNLLLNMNSFFIEDFNYLNENSFIINIENMEIINLIHFYDNNQYELTQDQLDKEIQRLKYNSPYFCLNNIIINTIPYNIQILFNHEWYKYSNNKPYSKKIDL